MSGRNCSPSGAPNHRSLSSTSSNRLSIREHLNQSLNNHHDTGLANTLNSNKEMSNNNNSQIHHSSSSSYHNSSSNHHHHSSYHPFKRAKYHQNGSSPTLSANSIKSTTPNQSTPGVSISNTSSSSSTTKPNSYLKCMQADSTTSPLLETLLHGERISCFVVGGEKRLCLHDILNTILKDFSVQQINSACQKLQIACLESSPRQLDILKKNHLLPTGAPNCGLLTQTNAERLCAFLMDQHLSVNAPPPLPPPSSSSSSSPSSSPSLSPNSPSSSSLSSSSSKKNTLKVVHECFGKTYGHIHLNMYSKSDAACVECDTCRKFYTPKNFVCHTHKYESHTRHWGFDSANWRVYLKPVNSSSSSSSSSEKTTTTTTTTATTVLSDIKISNKDNIAANVASSTASKHSTLSSSYNEEFELFKQKFQSRSQSPPSSRHTTPSQLLTPPNSTNGSGSSSSSKRKSLNDLDAESVPSSYLNSTSLTRHHSSTGASNANGSFSSMNKIRDHSNGSIENLNTDNRSSLISHHNNNNHHHSSLHTHHHQHQHPHPHHHHHNNINTNLININKKLNSLHHQNNNNVNSTNGLSSLNDLNNHLISSQGKNFSNQHDLKSNNNFDTKNSTSSSSNNNNKSNGEHRLLNGLLSKPLNNSSNEFSNR
jgi:hypothetical protein